MEEELIEQLAELTETEMAGLLLQRKINKSAKNLACTAIVTRRIGYDDEMEETEYIAMILSQAQLAQEAIDYLRAGYPCLYKSLEDKGLLSQTEEVKDE